MVLRFQSGNVYKSSEPILTFKKDTVLENNKRLHSYSLSLLVLLVI